MNDVIKTSGICVCKRPLHAALCIAFLLCALLCLLAPWTLALWFSKQGPVVQLTRILVIGICNCGGVEGVNTSAINSRSRRGPRSNAGKATTTDELDKVSDEAHHAEPDSDRFADGDVLCVS